MDSSDVDSMIDDMSFRELRVLKKSLGIKGKGNTKASLKRSIKAELKKSEDSESQKRAEVSDLDQRGVFH